MSQIKELIMSLFSLT